MPSMSIGGLASGLDTNSIITSLMAIEKQPRVRLTTQQTDETNAKTAVQTAITTLNSLRTAAQALTDPALFGNRQTASVADPTKATATVSAGAAAGGYQLEVTSLARASQASYAFTPPAADGTITLAGGSWSDTIQVGAGTTLDDLVARINGDASLHVVASRTTVGGQDRIVFASRETGAASGFSASAPGVLSDEQLKAGQNAAVLVDGVAHSSASNVLTDAIPGVQLTLLATTSSPTTVNVGVPGVDPDAVAKAGKAFVDAYNNAVDLLRKQTANDPSGTKGVLAADPTMNAVLNGIRDALVATDAGGGMSLPLEALGISTGAPSGTATYSADAVKGKLTFDETKLRAALAADPAAVRSTLGDPSGVLTGLSETIKSFTGTSGTLTARVSASDATLADISRRMADLDSLLEAKEAALTAQFGRLETAMSGWQAQSSWLSSQIAALGK